MNSLMKLASALSAADDAIVTPDAIVQHRATASQPSYVNARRQRRKDRTARS